MSVKKNDSNNIAIIGASGTGKTTLAVGLYATSTPEFTVSPVGEETRKYIEIRQSTIEEGYWPAATNEAENLDLRLRLHAGGKETDIVFREYMGECMEQPNYIQDVIGVPKAAMILFNPGMPDLKSVERRNMLIGNLKVIAQHLKDNQCAAVAFVVAASDRLTSDLAEFRDEFEEYVSEVTNHLGTLGLTWKRFDVTVSGELADQSHPKLARGENNTTHKPFLWLIERIRARDARIRTVRIAKWSAAIAAVALSIYGTLWVHCTLALSKVEGEMESIVDRLENAHMTKDLAAATTNKNALGLLQTDRLDKVFIAGLGNGERKAALGNRLHDANDLWSVRLLDMNLDNISGKLKKDPALLQPGWAKAFDDDLKLVNPTEANAVTELEKLKGKWCRERPTMEKDWQTAVLRREVGDKVALLNSTAPDKIPAQLKDGLEFLRLAPQSYPLVVERANLLAKLNVARTNALDRYCKSITTWRVEDKDPPVAGIELEQRLNRELARKISDEEFGETKKILIAQQKVARKEWEVYQLPRQTQSRIAELGAAGGNPGPALENSLAFLGTMTNVFSTLVSQAVFAEKRDAVLKARMNALTSYADTIASNWKEDSRQPPEFNERIWDAVLTDTVVTRNERGRYDQYIKGLFDQAVKKWEEYQKKMVDDFYVDGDIVNAVQRYGEFLDENANNPYLQTLHEKMEERLSKYFVDYMSDYYSEFFGANRIGNASYKNARMERAQQRFNEFRQVCLHVSGRNWSGSPIQKSAPGKFARLCVDRGHLNTAGIYSAFEQTIRVTKVEVKFDSTQLDSDYKSMIFSGAMIGERWNFSTEKVEFTENTSVFSQRSVARYQNGQWVELWSGNCLLRTNPWMFTSFRLYYEDYVDAFWSNGSDAYYQVWWVDYKTSSTPFEANVSLNSGGLNTNTQGKIYLRLTFEREGPDFKDLWNEAQK